MMLMLLWWADPRRALRPRLKPRGTARAYSCGAETLSGRGFMRALPSMARTRRGAGHRVYESAVRGTLYCQSLPGWTSIYIHSGSIVRKNHPDTGPPSLLSDKKWSSASSQSVQYDGDVTVTADLGGSKHLQKVHVLAYQRNGEFEVEDVTVSVSGNGRDWRESGVIENGHVGGGAFESAPLDLAMDVDAEARYVKFAVKKTAKAARILLAELVIQTDAPQTPDAPELRIPPTPHASQIHARTGVARCGRGISLWLLYDGCLARYGRRPGGDRHGQLVGPSSGEGQGHYRRHAPRGGERASPGRGSRPIRPESRRSNGR